LADGTFTAEPPGKSLSKVWLVPIECALEYMMFLKSLHGDAICDSCQLGWWKRQGSQRTHSAVLPVAPDRGAWSSVSAHGP